MNRRVRPTLRWGLSLTLFLPAAARAQTVEDSGVWPTATAQGQLGGRLRWWFDFQHRYFEDPDGIDQTLYRPALGHAFAGDASAWLGYAWVRTDLRSAHFDEHRIWEQLSWSPEIHLFDLLSRTRLEQRFLESRADVGWRLRQMFKGTHPLAFDDRLFLAAYEEVFFDLNDTDWGQDSGFSQNRFFAGLGWRFDPGGTVALEVGYLNQYIDGRGPARMNHILGVNLFLNF